MTEREINLFVETVSAQRMNRYFVAAKGDKAAAIELYRHNLRLSIECFVIISYFEITFRNAIDKHYTNVLGKSWILDAIKKGGIYDNDGCAQTKKIIDGVITNRLQGRYPHSDLVATLDLGYWRYQFAKTQYRAGGQTLMAIFPNKPTSSRQHQYDNKYVFNKLNCVNEIRNRIAHHEPLCFEKESARINLSLVNEGINCIITLFDWMAIEKQVILGDMKEFDDAAEKVLEMKR